MTACDEWLPRCPGCSPACVVPHRCTGRLVGFGGARYGICRCACNIVECERQDRLMDERVKALAKINWGPADAHSWDTAYEAFQS